MDPTEGTSRHGAPDEPKPARPARPGRRRRSGTGLGDTIGGALVGFDYQVFRATRPPAILVESATPVRGLSGEGGTMLSLDFPEDAVDTPAPADPDAEPD